MDRLPASIIHHSYLSLKYLVSWPSHHRNQYLHAWKQFYDLSPTYRFGSYYVKWELKKFLKSCFSLNKAQFRNYYSYNSLLLVIITATLTFLLLLHSCYRLICLRKWGGKRIVSINEIKREKYINNIQKMLSLFQLDSPHYSFQLKRI